MYCNYCGKKVLDSDKFCPFCGAELKGKKIDYGENASVESLQKRGMMFLEDNDFYDAEQCFERIIFMEPENFNGHLGKALATVKLKNLDELIDYYKNLYSNKEFVRIETCEEDKQHIDEIIKKYKIEKYFNEDAILSNYFFDRSINSLVSCRLAQKNKITREFENNTTLSRVKQYANKNTKKKINDIFTKYEDRVKEAEAEEKEAINNKINEYKEFLLNADKKTERMYNEALTKRENDYNQFVKQVDTENNLYYLKELLNNFIELKGFKESDKYIPIVEEKIKVEEERLNKEKKKRTTIISIIIAAVIILSISYSVYHTNVVVPRNKYNSAITYVKNNQFDKAISIFEELGDYQDCEDKVLETKYAKAKYLVAHNSYQEAIDIFALLGDYKDSKDNVTETKYVWGKYLYSSEKIKESLSILNEIKQYKDSEDIINEINDKYFLLDNLIDADLSVAKKALEENGISYLVQKVKNSRKENTILTTDPSGGYVKKDKFITLNVSLGTTDLSKYSGDSNKTVLYRLRVLPAGDKVRVRTTPVTLSDLSNKIANLSKGTEVSVYEILKDGNYTWYRIGTKRWIATESGWVERIN